MIVTEPKNLRIVIPAELKDQWNALVEGKGISQQKAIEALVKFLLDQDDLAQSVVLGQVKPTPDVMRVIFERIAEKAGDPRLRMAAKPTGPTRGKS